MTSAGGGRSCFRRLRSSSLWSPPLSSSFLREQVCSYCMFWFAIGIHILRVCVGGGEGVKRCFGLEDGDLQHVCFRLVLVVCRYVVV